MVTHRHHRSSGSTTIIYIDLNPAITFSVTTMNPKPSTSGFVGHQYLVVVVVRAKNLVLHTLIIRGLISVASCVLLL